MTRKGLAAANGFGSDCLAGVRTRDLIHVEADPLCTETLGWLGAKVRKVENPKGGDPGRSLSGSQGVDHPYCLNFNANKKSVRVDPKDPRRLQLIKDLADFAPEAIERLSQGAEVIRTLNLAIIYCQVKGFGEGSAYENNLIFDMIGPVCSGILSTTGERDGRPLKPGPSPGGTRTARLLSISILRALYWRKTTAQGDDLQVGMQV